MISQLFVQSARGDVIIFKDFKGNVPKAATDIFYRKSTLWDGPGRDAPPVFQADGVHFLHARMGGLYWVATTRENVSPSLVLELLVRIFSITRDYVGHVSEESVRKNFLLIYELLDEVVDYGFPQNSSTDRLKQFIAMEPVVSKPRVLSGTPAFAPSDVVKSVLATARTGAKEEIFVDIVERITAIFDSSGHLRSSSIVGSIQIKSYLGGNPPIRLGLCDNLVLGRRDPHAASLAFSSDEYNSASSSAVVLDSYSLHEAVDQKKFDQDRVLELVPPEGHFSLLTYRSSRAFRPPFRVYPILEDDAQSAEKFTLYVRLRAEYDPSKTASGVEVTVPLPEGVQRALCETDTPPGGGGGEGSLRGVVIPGAKHALFEQRAEWSERARQLKWSLKNLKGGKEHVLRARLTVDPDSVGLMHCKEFGPVMVQFVLPGKPSMSGLDVKYLKILKEEKGHTPSRWFRIVALANSYQIRYQIRAG